MTAELHGLPAAPGSGTGRVWRYAEPPGPPGSPRAVEGDRGREAATLEAAIATAERELLAMADRLRAAARGDQAELLEAQALIARDPEFLEVAASRIASGLPAAEAVTEAGEHLAGVLSGLDDSPSSARAADVLDVAARIRRAVTGDRPPAPSPGSGPWVIVADDLPPSALLELDRASLAAVALERGSPAAHLAIISRGLGLPAVVGISGLLDAAASAGHVEVNGSTGRVVMDPDVPSSNPGARAAADVGAGVGGAAAAGEVVMRDGTRITLKANLDRPEDAEAAIRAGAAGIGLFRTEHLVRGGTLPDLDAQSAAYRQVLEAAGELPVAFRLFDLGGDKPIGATSGEANPALGLRGIRLLRRRPELAVAQLMALLTASHGRAAGLQILVPGVADLADVDACRQLIARAAAELGALGVPHDARVELGLMVELPSAVLLAGELAEAGDYLSIGTNDLAQYLLAADRGNPELAAYHDPLHPAVLVAVRAVVEAAAARSVPVAVCGEMAADPLASIVLVGLGIRELSMYPAAFHDVAATLRRFALRDAEELTARCLRLRSVDEVRAACAEFVAAQ